MIIRVPGNCIPESLNGIIRFPGSPGIGSSSTPSTGTSLPVFWVFYVFFCYFDIPGSHFSMVPYRVVFYDIVCQVFLSLFPEYAEMISPDSVSDPIKYHVYRSIYFMLWLYVEYSVCWCIVSWHRCWWYLVAHISQGRPRRNFFLTVFK